MTLKKRQDKDKEAYGYNQESNSIYHLSKLVKQVTFTFYKLLWLFMEPSFSEVKWEQAWCWRSAIESLTEDITVDCQWFSVSDF